MSINDRIKILIDLLANGRQKIFAEATKLKTTTINGIVGPRQSEPSFSTLISIVDAYPMINLYWLIKGEGEPFNEAVNQKETDRDAELNSLDKESLEKINNSIFLSGNLKLLRKQIHETQGSFAVIFGVNRNNIASYERGSKPKLPFLLEIVNYFNISLEKLISFDLKAHPEILKKISFPDIKRNQKSKE